MPTPFDGDVKRFVVVSWDEPIDGESIVYQPAMIFYAVRSTDEGLARLHFKRHCKSNGLIEVESPKVPAELVRRQMEMLVEFMERCPGWNDAWSPVAYAAMRFDLSGIDRCAAMFEPRRKTPSPN